MYHMLKRIIKNRPLEVMSFLFSIGAFSYLQFIGGHILSALKPTGFSDHLSGLFSQYEPLTGGAIFGDFTISNMNVAWLIFSPVLSFLIRFVSRLVKFVLFLFLLVVGGYLAYLYTKTGGAVALF